MRLPFASKRRRIHKWFVGQHLRTVRQYRGEVPVSLGYWRSVQGLLQGLVYNGPGLFIDGATESADNIQVPELRKSLAGKEVGGWILDAESIGLLWRQLDECSPKFLLEFGSGVSTLVLAEHAARRNGKMRFLSVDQNDWAQEQTTKELASRGLDTYGKVIYAPLDEKDSYTVPEASLLEHLGGNKPDCVFIDGPFGAAGCRVHTLLRYGQYCAKGARWFLDDAFRNGEISALQRWQETPGLRVDGIYPVGKGLATGVIEDPALLVPKR